MRFTDLRDRSAGFSVLNERTCRANQLERVIIQNSKAVSKLAAGPERPMNISHKIFSVCGDNYRGRVQLDLRGPI